MMKVILRSLLISIFFYFTTAFILVVIDGKEKSNLDKNNMDFSTLKVDYTNLPPIKHYEARDGAKLSYRDYKSDSEKVLILLHGSGWHSKYFYKLAFSLSGDNYASIYTPDLRGHGINPQNRGDIDYINQYEDDLYDFITVVKSIHPNGEIILGGHSSGGGLAIRYAGSKYRDSVDKYMLLSPYLKYNSPTMIDNPGGWASVHLPRVIGLSMLNNIGIKLFNNLEVIDFNMPKEYRDGSETLTYTYRLNTGYAPRNYKKDITRISKDSIIFAGSEDETFHGEKFYPELSKYNQDINVEILSNVDHMGVVMDNSSIQAIKKWLNSI